MYKLIGADGKQYGPISPEQLRQWITEGRAKGDTLIQQEGQPDWKPLSSFAEFESAVKAAPPPTGMPPTIGPLAPSTGPGSSNRIAAGVCGILLGSLGIHKFILGYTGAGLIMLLVTVLTCGLGAGVMHIIGLIEGIIYLTKSDEEFVQTYVNGRKEWF